MPVLSVTLKASVEEAKRCQFVENLLFAHVRYCL